MDKKGFSISATNLKEVQTLTSEIQDKMSEIDEKWRELEALIIELKGFNFQFKIVTDTED